MKEVRALEKTVKKTPLDQRVEVARKVYLNGLRAAAKGLTRALAAALALAGKCHSGPLAANPCPWPTKTRSRRGRCKPQKGPSPAESDRGRSHQPCWKRHHALGAKAWEAMGRRSPVNLALSVTATAGANPILLPSHAPAGFSALPPSGWRLLPKPKKPSKSSQERAPKSRSHPCGPACTAAKEEGEGVNLP